jgi:hypothetical protein
MSPIRSTIAISTLALLFAVAANAQANFSMTGRAATGSGAFVDLPAKGNIACPSITGKVGFQSKVTATMTFPLIGPFPHNPGGCIPGGAAVVMTNGTGGFDFPVGFFKQQFPGGSPPTIGMNGPEDLQVSPVPNVGVILQLATSFKFTGPPTAPATHAPVNTTAADAIWRKFRHGAWTTQTGRTSSTFTACAAAIGMPSDVPCTFPSQGVVPGIVKNKGGDAGGGDGFGGTMALVLTTSPTQASSLAIAIGGGKVRFNIVGGMGSRAAGRGYADYDTDNLPGGDQWAMYVLSMTKMAPNNVIQQVTSLTGMGADGTNMNWGFPFTTGDIIVRGTGDTPGGMFAGQTVTAMGFDVATTMVLGITKMVPGGRNIQLVAGGVAQSTVQGDNGTPNYTVVRLPEPARMMQLLAGAAALLAVAVWRARGTR